MSLWSDSHTQDDILKSDDVFGYIEAVVNLYEDIQVLKEDIEELSNHDPMLFHECSSCNARCNCADQPCSCDCRGED